MGGAVALPSVDDPNILGTERIWRLFPDFWFLPDPSTGQKEFDETLFLGKPSALRAGKITIPEIDAAYGGMFAKHGIVELTADEIRKLNCVLKIDNMTPPLGQKGWPPDAHIIIGKPPTASGIRLTDIQSVDLKDLANQKTPIRPPSP
jgi:hypothetical protein